MWYQKKGASRNCDFSNAGRGERLLCFVFNLSLVINEAIEQEKKKLNAKCTIFPELGYSLIAKFHVKEVYV